MMCQTRRLYPLWILLLFVVLYIGRSIFEQTWMYMGLGAAMLIMLHLMNSGRESCCKPSTVYWIALIVYQLHQFEEHGIDLTGQAYAFEGTLNHILSKFQLGCPTFNHCPLNPENILYVNMLCVWLPLLIATHIAERRPFVAACYLGVIPSNAAAHIVSALIFREYNPGLFTAVALFLPFSFFYYRKAISTGYITANQGVASFIYGALFHPFLVLMMLPMYVQHDYPTILYPLSLILYVLFPLVISCIKDGGDCATTLCEKMSSTCLCCGKSNCNGCDSKAFCCAGADCDCCSKKAGCGCSNPNCQCACKKQNGEKAVKTPKKKTTATKAKVTKEPKTKK